MELGVAGMDSDDEKGFVGAEVVEGVECYAAWAGFGGGEEFGFALVEVGGGVDDGVGGLGEEWGCCESASERKMRRGMLAPLGWPIVLGGLGWSRKTAVGGLHPTLCGETAKDWASELLRLG